MTHLQTLHLFIMWLLSISLLIYESKIQVSGTEVTSDFALCGRNINKPLFALIDEL